jgi:hypothetical protein
MKPSLLIGGSGVNKARYKQDCAAGDHNGEATWRRITTAVSQLANNTSLGPVHRSARPRNDLAGLSQPPVYF